MSLFTGKTLMITGGNPNLLKKVWLLQRAVTAERQRFAVHVMVM